MQVTDWMPANIAQLKLQANAVSAHTRLATLSNGRSRTRLTDMYTAVKKLRIASCDDAWAPLLWAKIVGPVLFQHPPSLTEAKRPKAIVLAVFGPGSLRNSR